MKLGLNVGLERVKSEEALLYMRSEKFLTVRAMCCRLGNIVHENILVACILYTHSFMKFFIAQFPLLIA